MTFSILKTPGTYFTSFLRRLSIVLIFAANAANIFSFSFFTYFVFFHHKGFGACPKMRVDIHALC